MDAFSELKGLADTADGIINITKNHNRRLDEWFGLFRQAALDIASLDKNDIAESASNNEPVDKRKLPDIVPFVSETEIVVNQLPRISTALAGMRKVHIVHMKRNTPAKDSLSGTKNKSPVPEQHQPTFNETFVRFTTPDNNSETPVNDTSNKSANEDEKQEFYTPVGQNPELSELQTKTGRASRKRKSSSPLFDTASYKKVKVVNGASVSIQKKSFRKSLRLQHGKVSDTKFFKHHNRLPSSKISGSGMNSSVLKENRRVKADTEDNQPLKKVLAARQIKAQEAKRKREEKMQKISQQRLKLEKEKDERLRSRKEKEVEKPLLRTVLDSQKKRTREVEKNHNSEEVNEPPSAKRTRAKKAGTPAKSSSKKPIEKENRTTQDIKRNKDSEMDPRPTREIRLNKNETPKKTSQKKSTKVTVEENVNKKEDMNTTYSAKSSPTDIKENASTSAKAVGPTKEMFKTPVAPQRTISPPVIAKQSATVTKPIVDKSTPLAKKIQSKHLSQASSASSQSYEMTPARSSFVNYDVSEIKSDSEDEDDSKKNRKPVPGWASGVRLKNALVQQQYRPIDTDLIFGNVFETPDLVEMMGVKSKRYFKRTSSAIWNSPSAFM